MGWKGQKKAGGKEWMETKPDSTALVILFKYIYKPARHTHRYHVHHVSTGSLYYDPPDCEREYNGEQRARHEHAIPSATPKVWVAIQVAPSMANFLSSHLHSQALGAIRGILVLSGLTPCVMGNCF